MKKFSELTITDRLFDVNGNEYPILELRHVHSHSKKITDITVKIGQGMSQSVKEPDLTHAAINTYYSDSIVLYTSKYEALLNRKSVIIETLGKKMAKAISAVNEVTEYREKHYLDLNIDLIDSEIQKLKKSL